MTTSSEDIEFPPPSISAPYLPFLRIRINAPAALVFSLLTHTTTWPEWNTYVPTTEPALKMEKGSQIRFIASIPPRTPSSGSARSTAETDLVVEELSLPATDDPNIHRAVWSNASPSWTRPAIKRVNEVVALGEGECEYRTYEAFYGVMGWVTKMAMGGQIEMGLKEWADGLKKAGEKRWATSRRQ